MRRRLFLTALLLCCVVSGFSGNADSLLRLYRKAAAPALRAELAYQLALASAGDYKARHGYALEGFAAIRQAPPVPATVRLADALGTDFTVERRFDSAQYYFGVAAAAARRIGRPDLEYGVYANLGRLYAEQGDYPRALSNQLRVLSHWEQTGDTLRAVRTEKWVADVYMMMGRPKDALPHLTHAYNRLAAMRGNPADGAPERLERRKAASYVLYSQGVNFRALGDVGRSEAALKQTIAIMRETGDADKIANAYGELGLTLQTKGDLDGAVESLDRGVTAALAQGLAPVAAVLRQNMANAEMERGHYEEAYGQGKMLLAGARESGDIRIERGALETLAAIADSSGRWQEAYRYLQRLRVLDDTIASAYYQGGIADAETRYKTEAVLRTRDSLAYRSRIAAVQRREALQQRNLAVGVGGAVILFILVVAAALFRIRTIRARQQEEQRATRALFEGEQAERIRIARDLHDSIGQVLSVARMQVSGMGPQAGPSVALLDKTIDEVRTISHNLIPEELNFGLFTALDSLCDRINRSGAVRAVFETSDAVRSLKFSKPFETAVYRIVQEVVNNMLKHAGATEIRIVLEPVEAGLVLRIADNGRGFDTARMESSAGLGWKNIRARVGLLNGAMQVRSERITGTRIEIALPPQ